MQMLQMLRCCNCCNCCKCKCVLHAACCVTRQKRLQNAENLLLEIRVEREFKQTNSKCVRGTSRVPASTLCPLPLLDLVPCLRSVNPVYLRVHCAAPQSMQHKSAHNGVHACVCCVCEREREQEPEAALEAVASALSVPDHAFQ